MGEEFTHAMPIGRSRKVNFGLRMAAGRTVDVIKFLPLPRHYSVLTSVKFPGSALRAHVCADLDPYDS